MRGAQIDGAKKTRQPPLAGVPLPSLPFNHAIPFSSRSMIRMIDAVLKKKR